MKIEMIDINPTKETKLIDIRKETTLRKKDLIAMTQKIAIKTGISKGLALDHLTIAIDHTNHIPKNIETIEIVLEASKE